jgi:hypothetical protein
MDEYKPGQFFFGGGGQSAFARLFRRELDRYFKDY